MKKMLAPAEQPFKLFFICFERVFNGFGYKLEAYTSSGCTRERRMMLASARKKEFVTNVESSKTAQFNLFKIKTK
jgi:hypothetical protein